jgi:hypothetical protein
MASDDPQDQPGVLAKTDLEPSKWIAPIAVSTPSAK